MANPLASRCTPAILAGLLLKMVGTLSAAFPNLASLAGLAEYQGYDPLLTVGILILVEADDHQLMEDITTIIGYAAYRGAKLGKAMVRMSKEGRDKIAPLLTKYSVEDITPRGPRTMTVPRIIGAFPSIMAEILALGFGNIIGIQPPGFPRWLCFPAGPSLLPTNDVGDAMMELWREWNASFAEVVRAKASTIDYGSICRRSVILANKERFELVSKLSLLSTVPNSALFDAFLKDWKDELP